MLRLLQLIVFIIAILSSNLIVAANKDLDKAILFINLLNNTPVIQATVVQSTYKYFTHIQEEKRLLQRVNANFFFKHPLKFNWQVQDDFKQQIVSNGDMSWLYEPDIEQVIIKKIKDYNLAQTPILLLGSSLEKIVKEFHVSLEQKLQKERFTFISKQADSMFRKILITFDAGLIHLIQVYDNLSNLTEIVFTEVKKLKDLPDSHFNFIVPEGVEVIR
jgi:outer membrane lipoprotein carrier protein